MANGCKRGHPQVVSSEALAHNLQTLQYLGAWAAISSGLVAGVLGLESFFGLALYLLTCLALSASTLTLATNGLFLSSASLVDAWPISNTALSNAPSFVLFWTLSYGLLHVY